MRPKAKYAVIYRHRNEYPVSVMCTFFEVSRSDYYDFVKRIGKPEQDAALAKEIEECQNRTDRTYGCRRVWKWLKDRNIENCLESHEKIWFIVGNPPPEEVGKPWAAGTQVQESSCSTVSGKSA